MARIIQNIVCLIIFFGSCFSAMAQEEPDSVKQDAVEIERPINYSKNLLVNPDFDFKLNPTDKGKFILSFYNNEKKPLVIKVYDLIGNLILQETVTEQGPFTKEYDLSFYKAYFFMVEVGNTRYNKTKTVIASK